MLPNLHLAIYNIMPRQITRQHRSRHWWFGTCDEAAQTFFGQFPLPFAHLDIAMRRKLLQALLDDRENGSSHCPSAGAFLSFSHVRPECPCLSYPRKSNGVKSFTPDSQIGLNDRF